MTTSDRKVVPGHESRPPIRAAIWPCSTDRHVGESDLLPIKFGDASTAAAKGRSSSPWAIPTPSPATARPAPAGASCRTCRARRPVGPSRSGPARPQADTLHHFGTLIQTDAKLNLGTSGGALVNLKGEMVGLTVLAGRRRRLRAGGRLRHPGRRHVSPRRRSAQAGPRGRVRLPGRRGSPAANEFQPRQARACVVDDGRCRHCRPIAPGFERTTSSRTSTASRSHDRDELMLQRRQIAGRGAVCQDRRESRRAAYRSAT